MFRNFTAFLCEAAYNLQSVAVILITFLPPLIPPWKGGRLDNPVPSPCQRCTHKSNYPLNPPL